MKNQYLKLCALALVCVTALLCLCGCFDAAKIEGNIPLGEITATGASNINYFTKFFLISEESRAIDDVCLDFYCGVYTHNGTLLTTENVEYVEIYAYVMQGDNVTEEKLLTRTNGHFRSHRYATYTVDNPSRPECAPDNTVYVYNYHEELTVPEELFVCDEGDIYIKYLVKEQGVEELKEVGTDKIPFTREGDRIIFTSWRPTERLYHHASI